MAEAPFRPLPRSFYARPVLTVARDAIGKLLIHATPAGLRAGRIVETEAYRGPEDRAAHSFGGRRTARTEVMFGPPGHAYVFLIYGIHHHVNLVTTREGAPHAVLVRAIEPVLGVELMARARGLRADDRNLTNGPGKLCQALGIDLGLYGEDLCSRQLYLSAPQRGASGRTGPAPKVARSPRVGVDYAGAWAHRPWRFFEAENPWVSRVPQAPRTKTPGA